MSSQPRYQAEFWYIESNVIIEGTLPFVDFKSFNVQEYRPYKWRILDKTCLVNNPAISVTRKVIWSDVQGVNMHSTVEDLAKEDTGADTSQTVFHPIHHYMNWSKRVFSTSGRVHLRQLTMASSIWGSTMAMFCFLMVQLRNTYYSVYMKW